MPVPTRRHVLSAFLIISLIATAAMLRLAYEWRQALDDINSMMVTPAAIPLPTEIPAVAVDQITTASADTDAPRDPAPQQAATGADLIPTSEPPEAVPSLSRPTLNILLLGTDARPTDEDPTRTDAIVLVRLDRDTGRVSMLSIPRDLWVSYPTGGEGRINAAYSRGELNFGPGGGAALLKSTVGKLLDLEIDHFVLINFQGFETLIDQLGGIRVDVPMAIYDPAYPTEDYGTVEVRFNAGPQLMSGERALVYARTRHADNDFGRNQRQQLVLMAIFDRVRERGLLQQLTSLDDYTRALRGYVQTDLGHGTMLELANFARGINADNVQRFAIDNKTIYELRPPATFAVEPAALRRIRSEFVGETISAAGGE
jgi:LCP family protein required for cell wall assembly